MRTIICGSILIFLCQVGLSQNGLVFEQEPAWISSITYNGEVRDTANTSGGYYYLLIDRQQNPERQEIYRRYVTKVLSEKGLQFVSSINESFDPTYEKPIFHHVTLKRNGQIFDRLNSKKFEVLRREENMDRQVYDGDLSVILNLDDVQPGDIVDYSYTIRGSSPLFKGKFFNTFYLSFDVPVGKIHYSILTLQSRPVQFKYFNTEARVKSSDLNRLVSYSYERSNIPAFLWDDKTPDWYNPSERIEVSDFKSWEELNQWAQALFRMDGKISGPLSIKIKAIQSASANQEDWIRKSIEFVQDEIRYLSFSSGINSHKPHAPEIVFNQRFGDCKDKSFLLSVMLREMGIDCSPALVSTISGKILPERLPSPWVFNHCIVKINFRDSVYWLDPTLTFQRGKLRYKTISSYYHALVLNGKLKGLETIPFGIRHSGIDIDEKYVIEEIGTSASLDVITTYSGDEADFIRQNRQASSLEETTKNYLNFYASDYPTIASNGNVIFEDDLELNKIVTKESYKIRSFWKYDSSINQYSAETYARVISSYLKSPQTKIRSMPLALTFPASIEQNIKIYLPEPWRLKDSQVRIETNGFLFKASELYLEKVIHLKYVYFAKAESVEPAAIPDHIEKVGKALNNLSLNLTYTPNRTGSSSFNSPYFLIMVITSIGLFFAFRRVYEYDPEPVSEQHYDRIGGWLVLPGIGLFLTPFLFTFQIIQSGMFDLNQWKILTDSSYAAYDPKLGAFVLFELIANISLIGYTIVLNIIFWKRRSSLPRLIIVFYLSNMLLVVLDAWVVSQINSSEKDSMKELIRTVVIAIIWTVYFLRSDRVKSTFTTRRE